MRYKVGDRVRVRSDLKCEEYYDGVPFTSEMNRFKGMEFTIVRVNYGGYYEVLETAYNFTDEMLEPVEEMSAEEALKTYAEICSTYHFCDGCPIGDGDVKDPKECNTILSECTEDTLLRLKQWKADHEKKPIETEFVNVVRVIEDAGDTKRCVYEEEIRYDEDREEAQVRVLKEYCEDHNGKFFTVMESICRVKE